LEPISPASFFLGATVWDSRSYDDVDIGWGICCEKYAVRELFFVPNESLYLESERPCNEMAR